LGRLAVEALIRLGVSPANITAAVRDPKRASDLAERGVAVSEADYSKPETLEKAFDGIDRLLLVSSNEIGKRLQHHQNVIEAAKEAGVKLIAYTSLANADSSKIGLADEHRATEELIRASGIPYIFLRNGWYIENYTDDIDKHLKVGAIYGAANDGKISGATRADYAEAAAAAIASPLEEVEGKSFELGGPPFTLAQLAEVISEESGLDVEYKNMSGDELHSFLVSVGIPTEFAEMFVDWDAGIDRGDLYVESGDLERLIGRPATPLAAAVASSSRGSSRRAAA
jgi:NAD(P)H dehydrogenase (quinone)